MVKTDRYLACGVFVMVVSFAWMACSAVENGMTGPGEMFETGSVKSGSCMPLGNCPSNCILGREEGSGCYICLCEPCSICCQGYCYGPLAYNWWTGTRCPARCCRTSKALTLSCCQDGNCREIHEWWYHNYGF
ncbi:hypothetical protein BIW11_07685 [Tropilaelaps mercedesae]|uniref:Uncharacterized protein n=1 Tax=Tropilaelaps mercedesae TaxID=418985 RepID=A0A1V9XSX1_9ACAR|nr:hypothetical protein BIW11_07685 [Tropilaelaps mercedesae]